MAKGKTLNPADAHRKLLKKKENVKNKTDRKKAKEIQTVKKDTRSLEGDIRKLSAQSNLSAGDKTELAALRAELESIQKAKADYVEAHPEHRKFVYPESNAAASTSKAVSGPTTGLYGPDGKLKNPERSIYYDPVFNPFGAPPPGMPYREKPPTPEEMAAFQPQFTQMPALVESDESDEEDDDEEDDIEMPAGPPPDSDESDADSDDDIALPPGPPPIRPGSESTQGSRIDISRPQFAPGPPPGQPPPRFFPQPMHPNPHMRSGHFQQQYQQQQQNRFHPYQQQQQQPFHTAPPHHMNHQLPAPPHGAPTGPRSQHSSLPSFAGPHQPSPGSTATTLSGLPTSSILASASATISAAPQLRDFKAEVISFVPNIVKRKKPSVADMKAKVGTINATPDLGGEVGITEGGGAEEGERKRPSLMGALKDVGVVGGNAGKKQGKGNQDYDKFLENMQGLL